MPRLVTPALTPGSLASRVQPIFDLDAFVLRPWQDLDAPVVAAAYSDPDIQHWHARSMSLEEAHDWIASWPRRWRDETACGWAIADASGVLGQISLRRLDFADGIGELSYWVLLRARGRGVAPQAVRSLTSWAFGQVKLHRIELTHSVGNPASCRVAKKAAYAFEGIKRSEALHADGWHDMHLHAAVAAH